MNGHLEGYLFVGRVLAGDVDEQEWVGLVGRESQHYDQNKIREVQPTQLTEEFKPASPASPPPLAPATPDLLPLTTLLELFNWYSQNLCDRSFMDPRGYRVSFADTDFVHLIKLKDKYGVEPRNARMTIKQIQSGRITLHPARLDIRRAQELSWARSIIENPDKIVSNWQVMGRANPGDAYIRNFGTEEFPHHRVLICGHAGLKRRVVTIFARDRAGREVASVFWP